MTEHRDTYSPERRTALVLAGTGADGAYHAGVLRALHEAGVKIDLVAGRGVGAVGAVLTAVDGASRLWDARGLWRVPAVASLYRWRWPVRVVAAALAVAGLALLAPLLLLALAVIVYPVSLLLGMAGLEVGASVATVYATLVSGTFAPAAVPTWVPRLVTVAALAALLALVVGSTWAWWRLPLRRRLRGARAWALIGTPLDASGAVRHFTQGVWDLLKGGAAVKAPDAAEIGRRYTELLEENLGHPGFRELLLLVHDLDARRDLVFGLVREPFRRTLFPPPGASGPRRAEAFDLAGVARDHLIDALAGALAVPGLSTERLARFAPDGYWRGEAHRLTDRPASLPRLLEEAAAAGAEQVILVSATPETPGPHELLPPRVDALGRLSEHTASAEAAALRDALRHLQHRFRAVYLVRPGHNPVRPFDLEGAYDDRSDRAHALDELMERGYEDAYREFIDPIVGASGDRMTQASGGSRE